ncbi:MAG: hypothetical protein FWC89_03570 [Defluviitaleaceae bacterium]|nr:hypothetical protein [Defluviitaleaceae bacterium]
MKSDKIAEVYNSVTLSDEARKRIHSKVMQRAKKNNRQFYKKYKKIVAVAAAVVLFAVLGTTLLNRSDDIFFPDSPFVMRVYAMELQPDGTYVWREMDIALLEGWHGHYDGEVMYISIGLWFDFDGENISSVEFSLENGFFATQYIGNWGQVDGVPRGHVTIPPDFTTSRLVMYGKEFNKIGNTFTFGHTMPDDILLFWASSDMSYRDWSGENMVIEIDVNVTFEDGETHHQLLILDFYASGGVGMMSYAEGAIIPFDHGGLDGFTTEQAEYIRSAPMESFTYLPNALRELASEEFLDITIRSFEFYIGGHSPLGLRPHAFYGDENGVQRFPMGVQDGIGYVVIVEFINAAVSTARAYSIPLN